VPSHSLGCCGIIRGAFNFIRSSMDSSDFESLRGCDLSSSAAQRERNPCISYYLVWITMLPPPRTVAGLSLSGASNKVDDAQHERFGISELLRCCRIRYNDGPNDVTWFRYHFHLPEDEEHTRSVYNRGFNLPNNRVAC